MVMHKHTINPATWETTPEKKNQVQTPFRERPPHSPQRRQAAAARRPFGDASRLSNWISGHVWKRKRPLRMPWSKAWTGDAVGKPRPQSKWSYLCCLGPIRSTTEQSRAVNGF